jgi:molybdate transport system substrate-binding protein
MKRQNFLVLSLVTLFACLMTIGCKSNLQINGAPSASPITITVSAAASLQDVLEAITPEFQVNYVNIRVDYNFGSSGSLQHQIEQGAPVDVFFSAATKQMDALAEKDLILSESRQDLVSNSLVLIAPSDSTLEITDLSQLKAAQIRRLAVGEFRSVPVGQYSEQTFAQLGLLEPLRSKFVFGNTVRNVLAAVESGNADVGIVYATDVALALKNQGRIKALMTIPKEAHEPIVYPIAVLKGSVNADAARVFVDFLTSESTRQTFEGFGFGLI